MEGAAGHEMYKEIQRLINLYSVIQEDA